MSKIEIMKLLPSKKSRFISAVVVLLIIVLIGTVFFLSRNSKASAVDNPAAMAKVKKTSTTETTSSLPPLPQPQDSPVDEYADVPVDEIGTIEIPKIGLNTKMYEGVWLTVLNVGPGHWPGTAMPGGYGNTVIAGHRVTHSHPFRHIDDLVPGDEIITTTADGRFVYKVTGSDIVYPKDIWIVDQTPGFRITLFACHPPGSARQRYVIYGELENPPFTVGKK
jgi:sortase A